MNQNHYRGFRIPRGHSPGERKVRQHFLAQENLDSHTRDAHAEADSLIPHGIKSAEPAAFGKQVESVFEQLLSSEEAAALLKIHPKTLQKLARKGDVPGVRIGKMWAFRASALNRWLESKLAT